MPRKKVYKEEIVAFSIRLPRSVKDQIQDRAQENRRSLNQEIVWMLQQALDMLQERPTGAAFRPSPPAV
jgi:predicted HicB family RNase H-like nuclease